MFDPEKVNPKIAIIAIIAVVIAIFAGIWYVNNRTEEADTTPDPSYAITDYSNMLFSVSFNQATDTVTINTGHGYRNAAVRHLYSQVVDPTELRVTFTNYVNPFKAYE